MTVKKAGHFCPAKEEDPMEIYLPLYALSMRITSSWVKIPFQ